MLYYKTVRAAGSANSDFTPFTEMFSLF